jgi:enoyl-CoA hydratase
MSDILNLTTSLEEGIYTITINRPDKLNALNIKTLHELSDVVRNIYDDPQIKGAIITGSGSKAFVAGADIKEISDLNDLNARKFSEHGQEIFGMIEQSAKPIIAAVNGFALGGGCELAMACHIRVASDNARFGLPEVNLGLIPGFGGTQRLTQLVGKGKALELMMTADLIAADEAKQLGLVNHVVTSEQLIPKTVEILRKIFEKAPLAIAQVVECVNAAYNEEEDGYQTEANSFGICCKSDDFHEGTRAFLEKRKPNFRGR